MRRPRTTRDSGSVLPLVVGAVVLVVALVTVVADAGVLWLQRRSLQATADGAALAGAQSLDLAAVYAEGARGDLALDPSTVRTAVRTYVRGLPSTRRLGSFRVVSVRVVGPTVTVRAEAVAHPPFLRWLTGRGITVVAEAAARSTAG